MNIIVCILVRCRTCNHENLHVILVSSVHDFIKSSHGFADFARNNLKCEFMLTLIKINISSFTVCILRNNHNPVIIILELELFKCITRHFTIYKQTAVCIKTTELILTSLDTYFIVTCSSNIHFPCNCLTCSIPCSVTYCIVALFGRMGRFSKVRTSVICREQSLRICVSILFALKSDWFSAAVFCKISLRWLCVCLCTISIAKLDILNSNRRTFRLKGNSMSTFLKYKIERIIKQTINIINHGFCPSRCLNLRRTNFVILGVSRNRVFTCPDMRESSTCSSIIWGDTIKKNRKLSNACAFFKRVITYLQLICTGLRNIDSIINATFLV